MGGQYLDLLEQARGGGSVERALRVARYKSAKYTIERPLHLGAALAGAGRGAVLDGLLRLRPAARARPSSCATTCSGVFGDPAQTGKPAGDDLREGKRTALVAMALRGGRRRRRPPSCARHLGDPHLAPDGVEALRTVHRATPARVARVEALIAELHGRRPRGARGRAGRGRGPRGARALADRGHRPRGLSAGAA